MFCHTMPMVLRAMPIARAMLDGLSSMSTTSAASMAASEPIAPMAMPMSARVSTGASLMRVAHERELALAGAVGVSSSSFHFSDLVLRQQLRPELVEAQLTRHGGCHVGAVARQHDGLLHACGPQRGGMASAASGLTTSAMTMCPMYSLSSDTCRMVPVSSLVAAHAAFAHQLVVAHQHHVLVDLRAHAVAALLLHVVDALLVDGT